MASQTPDAAARNQPISQLVPTGSRSVPRARPRARAARRSEADRLRGIRLALGAVDGLVLWRNGVAGVEAYDHVRGGARHHHAGLPTGSSDLIGMLAPTGRLIALEVKTDTGKLTEEQLLFLALVRRMGGFGAVVRDEDEARAAIARARGGAFE